MTGNPERVDQGNADWYLPDGQPRFSIVPVWVTMTVRSDVLRVYSALASFAGKDRECYPGKESIARRASRSLRFVPKAIRELEAIGAVIVTERPGHTNSYSLPLDPSADALPYIPGDAQRGREGCTGGSAGMHSRTSEETEETYEETNKENLIAPPSEIVDQFSRLMARQSPEAWMQDSSPSRPIFRPGQAPAHYCGVCSSPLKDGDCECGDEHSVDVDDWEAAEVGA